jgi:hypothetical protein
VSGPPTRPAPVGAGPVSARAAERPRRGDRATFAVLAAFAALAAGACAARPAGPAASAFAGADSLRTRDIDRGVTHTFAWEMRGPWAVHVLTIERAVCRPVLRARKAGPPLSARARTSDLVTGDRAGINADFFLLPGGTPVGPHVTAGAVRVGPGLRPALGVDDARLAMGTASVQGTLRAGADVIAVAQVNRPLAAATHHPAPDLAALFDAWFGDTIPTAQGRTLMVNLLDGDVRQGRGVVAGIAPTGTTQRTGFNRIVVQGGSGAQGWLERRQPGDTVTWSIALDVGGLPRVTEAVGGFPVLVRDGRNVVAQQQGVIESFGAQRHPRTAVGWNETVLHWVVVDGRQPPYSDGMTLDELADLLVRLGAREAINLDGGGSTAMVVAGAVVNRPSDAEGERTVSNALALEACR